MRGALARYRVMAYTVGVGLVVLVLVGMPLKYGADIDAVVSVVGPLHGVLYIVYLVSVLDVARTRAVRPLQVVAMIAAGLVPFLAFYVERRVSASAARRVQPARPGSPT